MPSASPKHTDARGFASSKHLERHPPPADQTLPPTPAAHPSCDAMIIATGCFAHECARQDYQITNDAAGRQISITDLYCAQRFWAMMRNGRATAT